MNEIQWTVKKGDVFVGAFKFRLQGFEGTICVGPVESPYSSQRHRQFSEEIQPRLDLGDI
jgi:hypothetical protein